MNKRQPTDQQMNRERAVYRYLAALDAGDIDVITEVLQQATYDAQLEQMILEAHQVYFQEEASQQTMLASMETQTNHPSLAETTLRSGPRQPQKNKRRVARWMQVLVATLILGILVGTFIDVLTSRSPSNSHPGVGKPTSTPAAPACKPRPWQIMDAQTEGHLVGIAAFSPADAWAVGSINFVPLIEHWDGQKWSKVRSPLLPGITGELEAVAEISPDNVWAVGYQHRSASATTTQDTLIEHWDGQQWSIVLSPNIKLGAGMTNTLSSIAVVSANDIWATGIWTGSGVGTLSEHWNGQTWSVVPGLENQNGSSMLWSVTVAGERVLAGGSITGSDKMYQPLLERWDGQRWQAIDTTPLGPNALSILSLSMISESNIWAIVQEHDPTIDSQAAYSTYVEHWDGQKWSKVLSPAWLIGTNQMDLLQIRAMHNGSVWVIGRNNIAGAIQPLAAFWNGKTWQRVNLLPGPGAPSSTIPGDLAASAGAVWIVGAIEGPEGSADHPFIEGQLTCP